METSTIGGFGISAADDLLFIEDIELVAQTCTWVHVAFDDEAVADFFDRQVDVGRRPEQFGRIWVHTHPGKSPEPSGTDELTFTRVFGRAEWALMFILARGGQTYARLRYNVGPGADVLLPVEVDYSGKFAGSSNDAWREEYRANVRLPPLDRPKAAISVKRPALPFDDHVLVDDWGSDAWDDHLDFEQQQQEGEYGFVRDF